MFSKRDLMNMEGIMMLHAIQKYGGKRTAAKFLNTSIDTLNKYLSNLENELGVKLVASDEKGCFLTPNGEQVTEIAEEIKNNLQQAYNVAPISSDIKGEVKIIYESNVRSNFYIRHLRDFLDKYSNLSIFVDTCNLVPNMSNLDYDICLSYHIPKGNDLVVVAERKTPCGFFASQKYLENHDYPQNIEDILLYHRLILKRDCKKWVEEAPKFMRNARRLFLSNSTFAVNDMIMNGGGIGIMPTNFAKEGVGLVCLDNIPCETNSIIYLVTHDSIKDIPKIRVVLNYYKDILKNL